MVRRRKKENQKKRVEKKNHNRERRWFKFFSLEVRLPKKIALFVCQQYTIHIIGDVLTITLTLIIIDDDSNNNNYNNSNRAVIYLSITIIY